MLKTTTDSVICTSGPLFWCINTHNVMWLDIDFHRGGPGACRRFCPRQHHYVFAARGILASGSGTWPGLLLLKFQGVGNRSERLRYCIVHSRSAEQKQSLCSWGRREVLNAGNGHHAAALWGCNQGLTSDAIFLCVLCSQRMEQNECECPCECPLEVNECTGNLTNAENR